MQVDPRQNIDKVNANCGLANADFSFARVPYGYVFKTKDLGAAGLANYNCLDHKLSPLSYFLPPNLYALYKQQCCFCCKAALSRIPAERTIGTNDAMAWY